MKTKKARVKWVRGKALETLLALKGVQVGDVVLTDRWNGRGVSTEVLAVLDSGIGVVVKCKCTMKCFANFVLHYHVGSGHRILGWRRP